MTMIRRSYRSRLMAVFVAASFASAGCSVVNRSSLTSSTGPSPDKPNKGLVAEHWAHVGEKVDFTYAVLTGGPADYALLSVLPSNINKVSLTCEAGHFTFGSLTFNEPTPPGKPLTVKAYAYRQREERDFMDDDGKLLVRESPSDVPDALIATAQIKLHVYQSKLIMQVPALPAGYRWETARLTIHGSSDAPAEVYPDRPYRKGFHVEGPNVPGGFLVTYEPTADQIHHTGTTRVVLTVQDAQGHDYHQETFLPTP